MEFFSKLSNILLSFIRTLTSLMSFVLLAFVFFIIFILTKACSQIDSNISKNKTVSNRSLSKISKSNPSQKKISAKDYGDKSDLFVRTIQK